MYESGTCLRHTSVVALGKPVFVVSGAQTHVYCMEYYLNTSEPSKREKKQLASLQPAIHILTPESGFISKYCLKSGYSCECPDSTRWFNFLEFFLYYFTYSLMLKYSVRDFSCTMIFEVLLSPCLFLITFWQMTAHYLFSYILSVFLYALWFVYFVAIYSRVSHKAVGTGNDFLRAKISLQQFHKWKVTQRINRCNERTNAYYKLALLTLITQRNLSVHEAKLNYYGSVSRNICSYLPNMMISPVKRKWH